MYEKHRPAIEALIGRRLRKDESVHHIDNNPLNDEPSNLALMSHGDHVRLHRHLLLISRKGGDSAREFIQNKYTPRPPKVAALDDLTFKEQLGYWAARLGTNRSD